jgi:PEGA domain
VLRVENLRISVLSLLAFGLLFSTADAKAQPQAVARPAAAHPLVVVHPVYGYPYFPGFYNPWFSYGYPWGPYPLYGYGQGIPDPLTSSVRLEVTPRNAKVFVDGYDAGRVDEYDGMFQRLRLRPGSHEIVLYLEGYKTVRQNLYLNPGTDQKIKFALEPLAAGEVAEPPPFPRQPPEGGSEPSDSRFPFEPREAPEAPPVREAPARFGTLSIRIQPADAEILVDGEPWSAPSGQDRISIQLAEGRHRVEIRKQGFTAYREDVLIRAERTLTLNVSLLRGDAR